MFVFRSFFKCEPNFSMLQDNYCHLRNTFVLFWEVCVISTNSIGSPSTISFVEFCRTPVLQENRVFVFPVVLNCIFPGLLEIHIRKSLVAKYTTGSTTLLNYGGFWWLRMLFTAWLWCSHFLLRTRSMSLSDYLHPP